MSERAEGCHRLFVYGSLLRGLEHHHELVGAEFMREVQTAPDFTLVDLGPYPAVIRDGATSIRGELHRVDDAILTRLDGFEGVPDYYERVCIELDGDTDAWIYVMAATSVTGELMRSASAVPQGCWKHHLRRRENAVI